MLTFFESLLLGHFVGDYILQNNWMALNKTKRWLPCLIHCLLYTLAVCLFTWILNPWWILVVFASHIFIDHWSLADKYLELTKGRSLTGFMMEQQGKYHAGVPINGVDLLSGGFTALVYCVIDNTFHILLMVGGMALLRFLGVM